MLSISTHVAEREQANGSKSVDRSGLAFVVFHSRQAVGIEGNSRLFLTKMNGIVRPFPCAVIMRKGLAILKQSI